MSLLVPVGTVCTYCMLLLPHSYWYSTVLYRRDLLPYSYSYRTLAGQECDIKGGSKGGVPPGYVGGGLKNRRFPPPHPSDDNVLYSKFAPCLVCKYPLSFYLRYLYIRPISRTCVSVRPSVRVSVTGRRLSLKTAAEDTGPHEYRTFCYDIE